MGGINHGANWWWEFFLQKFFDLHTTIKGEIVLSFGKHELNIDIGANVDAKTIYVNCDDMEVPVCVGAASLISARLMPNNSFNLYADIKSNTCTVKWLIEYDPVID